MGSSGEMMDYQVYISTPRTVGEETTIEGVSWMCVENCTLLGYTIDDHIPVLEGPNGPMLNEGQLMLSSHFKVCPKPEYTCTENLILNEYEWIHVEDLVGRNIQAIKRSDDRFVILCDGKSYFKLVSEYEKYESIPLLRSTRITIDDLRWLGALSEEEISKCNAERCRERDRQDHANADRAFRAAVNRVGPERAKKLLDKLSLV
jgi:hypothetical protein